MVGLGPRLLCSQHPLMSVQETFQCRVIGLFSLLFETFWMWAQTLKCSTRQEIPFPCVWDLRRNSSSLQIRRRFPWSALHGHRQKQQAFGRYCFPEYFYFILKLACDFLWYGRTLNKPGYVLPCKFIVNFSHFTQRSIFCNLFFFKEHIPDF